MESLFLFIAMAVRPPALVLDRTDGRACALRSFRAVAVLCEERALVMGSETAGPWAGGLYEASGSSSISATGVSGVVRFDGLERRIGEDIFLLNKEITADKLRQRRPLGIKVSDYLG